MSVLFDDSRLSTRPHGRSTTGLWISVALHAIVVVVLIAAPIRATETPSAPRARSRTVFVLPATQLVKLPSAPLVAPRLPAPPPRRPIREVVKAEVPKPVPVAPVVAKAIVPAPAPIVPAASPTLERPIEKAVIHRPLETGLFERTNGTRTSEATAAVTTGGFGSAAAAPRDASNGPGVTTGGFNSGAPAPRGTANGEVRTAGFDQRASAPAQPSVAATKPIDRPAEIVFKPTPEYTDEARSARIEGTVSLELEFTAAGDVRVLRVVRGLGHGLDEAAERSALRIRFKPAQSDGRPVDSRATVHITFRLS
jgi:TonB family protein